MQLQIKKSGRFTYLYAIKSYRTDDGKSTTKVVRKFGTVEELSKTLDEDPIEWARTQVEEMTILEKEESKKVTYEFNPSRLLDKGEQRSYNGGYLFLQKIYHDLGLHKICDTILKRQHKDSKNHDIKYNLNEILSMLLYTRILYPGSKLSSLEDAGRFIEQPNTELHQIYRALSLLSKESDFIQSQVYKNSLKLGERNTRVHSIPLQTVHFKLIRAVQIILIYPVHLKVI